MNFTIKSGQSASEVEYIGGEQIVALMIPSTFDGNQLVINQGTTKANVPPLYDEDGSRVVIPVAASTTVTLNRTTRHLKRFIQVVAWNAGAPQAQSVTDTVIEVITDSKG